MSSKNPNVTYIPSRVQFLILPVKRLPISGLKTMYLKVTSVCDDPTIVTSQEGSSLSEF